MPEITPALLLNGFFWFVAFLFSTTCHEAAHALAARMGGDQTASSGGQVSLNPWPHIRREPMGMVLVPLASFLLAGAMMGWASAPYDPRWQRRHPHRAGWMALAGPAANFTLMLIAGLALRMGISGGFFHAGMGASGGARLAWTILEIFFTLNLLLGVFNLLPFPPLEFSIPFTISRRACCSTDCARRNGGGKFPIRE
ncbi:MAG: site-2 protease family protein [Acidobacteriia bacterium]|nr:site-2 protease family protein [Terriglobia bacterium]